MKTARSGVRTVAVALGALLFAALLPAVPGPASPGPAASGKGEAPPLSILVGRWQRPDGGYLLEIRGVGPDGALDAGYFNPEPVRVAVAEAERIGPTLHVYIELRDENYPGSAYRLTYDPGADRLRGTYFQAVARETYAIEFARLKP